MAAPGKKSETAKPARERMRAHRAKLRAQGLRPVQFWVPDVRDPEVLEHLRREAERLDNHPEIEEIDAFDETAAAEIYDEIPPYDDEKP